MADFNSLEKQISDLSQAMTQGFESLKTELQADIAELAGATAVSFSNVEERLEILEQKADTADQKLERIERNQLTQAENHILLETRVTKLEQPVV